MSGAITPDRLRVRRTYHTSKKRHETSALPSATDCNADRKIQFPYLCFIAFSNSENSSNRANLPFQAGGKTATRDDFGFLGIDQSTLQLPPMTPEEIANSRAFQLMTERQFPWSREVWSLLLDRLFGAGTRLVVFDLIFSPPNDGDPAFHAALDRYHDKVVLGANFDMQNAAKP